MVYLLSEIRESNCINESIIIRFNSHNPQFVVLAKLKKLEFYQIQISQNDALLKLVDVLNIDESIQALGKLNNGDKQWLILLSESQKISIIGFKDDVFIRRAELQFITKGHQRSIDSNITILTPKNNQSFFIVHNFQGFIQLVIMNQKSLNEPKSKTKYKKRLLEEDLWEFKTLALGNIVVKKMVLLQGSSNTLAILYRDFNYNYSMRFYSIDLEKLELKIIKQFEEFDTPPTDLIALLSGGILVLSNTHIFYFPDPQIKYLSIKNTNDNSLSININQKVVTKINFNHNDVQVQDIIFKCHAIIDDSRILIITNTGMSFLLYFSAEKFPESITINNIRLIKLGHTTISNSVHYISNGIFFASSRLSQSLLFNICSQSPFVNICEFLPSSPPILDIDLKYKQENIKLLTCQGGYNSGEFRCIENSKFKLKFLNDLQVHETDSISVHQNSSVIEVRNRNGSGIKYNCSLGSAGVILKPLDSAVKILSKAEELYLNLESLNISSQDYIYSKPTEIISYSLLGNGSYIYVSKSNDVHFSGSNRTYHSLSLSPKTEVSDIDLVQITSSNYVVLLSFWNNGYVLYSITSEGFQPILHENTIGNTSGIYSGKIFYNTKSLRSDFWIILSNSKGSLIMYNISLLTKEKINFKEVIISNSGFPLKIMKKSPNDIFLYNRSQIIGLIYNEITNSFKLSNILIENGIDEVKYIKDNILAVLIDHRYIKFFELIKENQDRISFSNFLNLKSIHLPDSNLSVLISIEKKCNLENNEIEKYCSLRLVDNQFMKIIHVYEFRENEITELTGLTYIPNGIDTRIPKHSFIALSNSNKNDSIILMFTIKKGKIVLLPKVEISGIIDISLLSPVGIIPLNSEEFLYFIFGNLNFILHLDILNDEMKWKVHPKSAFQLPTTTICASSYDEKIIVGDMLKGIYKVKLTKNTVGEYISSISKILPEYEANFLTSIQLSKGDVNNDELFFSDSLGNISTLFINKKTEKYIQTSAFNIGEQINVIKSTPEDRLSKGDFYSVFDYIPHDVITSPPVFIGTVSGAIYLLSRIDDEEIEEILSKCIKELMLYKDTLTEIPTKNKKLEYQKARYNWRSLKSDDFAEVPNKESFGVADLSLIKKWLEFENFIQQKKYSENYMNTHVTNKELKNCHLHKPLLERIIHELEI